MTALLVAGPSDELLAKPALLVWDTEYAGERFCSNTTDRAVNIYVSFAMYPDLPTLLRGV